MKTNTHLSWSIAIVVGSAIYAFLVAEAPRFAEAIALGYIAVLLTVIASLNLWKG